MIDIFLISAITHRRKLMILKKATPQKIIFSRDVIIKKTPNKILILEGPALCQMISEDANMSEDS